MLIFLPAAAWTRIVATDLLASAREGRSRDGGWRIARRRGECLVVAGVLIAHIGYRRLFDRLNILLRADLNFEHDLDHVLLDMVEHVGEKLECLALVLLLGILLRVTAKMNTLPEVVQRRKVLPPVLVERLQHEITLELVEELAADQHHLGVVLLERQVAHPLADRLVRAL